MRNLYVYVGGNPINLRDPSGHDGLAGLLVTAGITFLLASMLDKNYANAPEIIGGTPGPIYHAQPFAGNDAIEWAILGGGFSRVSSFFRPLLEEVGVLRPAGSQLIGQVAPAGVREAEQAAQAFAESTDQLPSMTFRGDTRPPSEIFNNGFAAKGSNMNLQQYVFQNPADAGYVGTSRSLRTATEFANSSGNGGYVYFVRPTGGVNVNGVLGTGHVFASELEIAIPNGIASGDIMGAMQVGADGQFTGELILNQNFTPTAN